MKTTQIRTPKEDTEQMHVFKWAALEHGAHPELSLLFAIPNGGHRDKVTGALMKATGVKAGVPDMCLPVARGGYHGLYIELKRKVGGQVSVTQKQWIISLQEQGYMAKVCKGADEAIATLTAYLNMPGTGKS